MKRSVVNSGFLPPKVEKPTLMVGSLGWPPVRSSVGDEAELAALLGPVLGKGPGQFGQREPVGFLAVDQGFDDVGGQGRQLENAGHIRAIGVEGTGKLADGLDLAGFEDVGPGKGPSQRLEDGGLHRFLRSCDFSIQGLGSDDRLAAAEFLTRLARHSLIEFLPDKKASVPWPERFLEALETVRVSGRTNMLTTRR